MNKRETRPAPTARIAAVAALVAIFILLACGPSVTEPEEVGIRTVVRVLPFEVEGQVEDTEYVGNALAGSLSSYLALAGVLLEERSEIDLEADTDRDVEHQPEVHATHLLAGTLIRDAEAVHARLQMLDAGTRSVLWEVEATSHSGAISGLVSLLAMETTEKLGISYPDLYEHITNIPGGPGMSASPLRTQALKALRRFDLEELRRLSSELVVQFGDDPASHTLNAAALAYSWDTAPTEETLNQLKDRLAALNRVDPSNPYDDLMRAYLYRSSGEPDRARILYSRLLARTDLSVSARGWVLRQRSYAELQVGNREAGRDDALESVRIDPAEASGHFALSRALQALGDMDGSISHARQAMALEPAWWRYQQRLGLVLSQADRFDEAFDSLSDACRSSSVQEACANLAVSLQRAGRDAEARETAEYAASNPESPWGLYNLACYWSLAGENRIALDRLFQAVELGFAHSLITTDTDLDPLRLDPEFEAIIKDVEKRLRSKRQLTMSTFPWQA